MLTKSDFMNYLECPLHLWLSKHRPELLPKDSPEKERILAMGRQVDEFAKTLFPAGQEISGFNEAGWVNTRRAIAGGARVLFQPSAVAGDLAARADILVRQGETDVFDMYEVKMSTEAKKEYVFDTGFQKFCFERAGVAIGNIFLVHINKEYVRHGAVEPEKLFSKKNITADVERKMPEVEDEIGRARTVVSLAELSRALNLCSNPKSCEYLEYACARAEEIYPLAPQISPKHLMFLLERGIVPHQHIDAQTLSLLGFEPEVPVTQINANAIRYELQKLQYPLYFFDYESFSSPIPPFDGTRPYQQIPFQYSLHIQEGPGAPMAHREFLMDTFENPVRPLLESLKKDVGPVGSVVVWFALFESTRNKEMAQAEPDFADFLHNMNDRMFDLMVIFKFKNQMYIKSEFKKLASLKVVLPVLCPELSYDSLAIREGGTASASWPIMADSSLPAIHKAKLRQDMLEYCKRDTHAMLAIHEHLTEVIK